MAPSKKEHQAAAPVDDVAMAEASMQEDGAPAFELDGPIDPNEQRIRIVSPHINSNPKEDLITKHGHSSPVPHQQLPRLNSRRKTIL
jgi:hypothetical protein